MLLVRTALSSVHDQRHRDTSHLSLPKRQVLLPTKHSWLQEKCQSSAMWEKVGEAKQSFSLEEVIKQTPKF